MIRFIDLGDQILEGQREFAWWDTVIDEFLEFAGSYVWDNWQEFEEDYEYSLSELEPDTGLERYKRLFPSVWP